MNKQEGWQDTIIKYIGDEWVADIEEGPIAVCGKLCGEILKLEKENAELERQLKTKDSDKESMASSLIDEHKKAKKLKAENEKLRDCVEYVANCHPKLDHKIKYANKTLAEVDKG